ncbi:hypothetical protein RB596_003924 [Gaeumannomyces avenae]
MTTASRKLQSTSTTICAKFRTPPSVPPLPPQRLKLGPNPPHPTLALFPAPRPILPRLEIRPTNSYRHLGNHPPSSKMDVFKTIAACFGGADPKDDPRPKLSEKAQAQAPDDVRSADEVSDEVVELLRTAEKNGPSLQSRVRGAVGARGWTENVARAVVSRLETVIKEGRDKVGQALAEVIDRAEEAAKAAFEFSKENPYLVAGFATIVAIGVLVLVAPWAVEALGFARLGPVANSFASWWQSTYAGFVPKGSLFSFFQRLGMVWAR